jgi:hypothetical protein
MPPSLSALLEALRRGEPRLLRIAPDNLVARPWGGHRLPAYKGIPDPEPPRELGESFEVSAFPADRESGAHPSEVELPDGGRFPLLDLLGLAPRDLLGDAHVRAHGPIVPLLPKTLDVRELLSVQAHPPGQLELYVVIEAEPGATMRLGFRQSVVARDLEARLSAGRRAQERLLGSLRADLDQAALQAALAPRMGTRNASFADAATPWLRPEADPRGVAAELEALRTLYWEVLDLLNEIPLRPGQVILNATPPRLAGSGPRSAEMHALGSPDGKGVLALEIRRPGTTLRAWDNMRYPLREIDVAGALAAANLQATTPEEFLVEPQPIPDTPGVFRLLEADAFVVDSLRPRAGAPVRLRATGLMHTLHAIAGAVRFEAGDGSCFGTLERGRSALLPACLPAHSVVAVSGDPDLVKVTIP